MKKRLIALILIIVLCVTVLVPTTMAENAKFIYKDEDIKELYYDFEHVSSMLEHSFCKEDGLAYWKYVNNMKDNKFMTKLISFSNRFIGEIPDKKYYVEILTNMIAMFEYDTAGMIEQQSRFDNMKNVKEYGMDLLDIGANIAGIDGTAEHIAQTLKAVAEGAKLVANTSNELKYYELIVSNYANAENFLKAVSEYSDNKLLSEAARELRYANELLMKERMSLVMTTAGNLTEFSVKTVLVDLSYKIMKNCDEYKTDSVVTMYVDYGEKAYKALDNIFSTGEAVFKILMMGGDLLFGTTNTFRRHNEMETMAHIAKAIIAANNEIQVSENMPAQTLYSNIKYKSDLYKMLIATHLRGEYLIYSLTDHDAGVLSILTKWWNETFEDNSIRDWYDSQADYCEEYYDMINEIFERVTQHKFVVQNGFELHDGFIVEVEQKDTVPEGYKGIYTFDDFKNIADSCPSDTILTSIDDPRTEYNTAKYILMNDIVVPAGFDPACVFLGTLDGNGYTMKNVDNMLFKSIENATIVNLGVEINIKIDMEDNDYHMGAIAGSINTLSPFRNNKGCIIDNCFVKGKMDISSFIGYAGGFIGDGNGVGVKITNCYNDADISLKVESYGRLGGISGENGQITNCYNTGDISIYKTSVYTYAGPELYAGGIQGYNSYGSPTNCYNTGSVSASSARKGRVSSGGIIGFCHDSGVVKNCYNIGSIKSDWNFDFDVTEEYGNQFDFVCSSAGGLVGFVADDFDAYSCSNSGDVTADHMSGGIVGRIYTLRDGYSDILNCYNEGTVASVQYAGGIIGRDFGAPDILNTYNTGIISNGLYRGAIAGLINKGENNIVGCYYLDNGTSPTSAGSKYSGVKALSAEQMADAASFVEFDFFEVWKLREGDNAPRLKQYRWEEKIEE